MLVRPGRPSSLRSDHFEDRVGPQQRVGKERHAGAVLVQMPRQLARIDRVLGDVSGVVDVDALVEDHHVAGGARAGGVGGIEHGAVVAHVVEHAVGDG